MESESNKEKKTDTRRCGGERWRLMVVVLPFFSCHLDTRWRENTKQREEGEAGGSGGVVQSPDWSGSQSSSFKAQQTTKQSFLYESRLNAESVTPVIFILHMNVVPPDSSSWQQV